MDSERTRLEVENLDCERVALLGEAADRKGFFLGGKLERRSSCSGCLLRTSSTRWGMPESVV